jgi:hypothetical protein
MHSSGEPDIPEDPLLGPSLDRLSTIQVPADFLPNVMYRVYEKNARQRLNWVGVVVGTLALLALSLGFLAWDISLYQEQQQFKSFSEAMEARISPYTNSMSEVFAAFGGMLNASWQLLSGLMDTQPGLIWGGAILLLIIFGVAWWQRSFLMRRS